MITLHNTVEGIKKLLKWTVITVGILLCIMVVRWIIGVIFPPPVPPPTVLFGKLPPIEFPESMVKKSLTYSINTVSGKLPVLNDRYLVYEINNPEPDILSFKKAQDLMSTIGLKQGGYPLSETVYQWSSSEPLHKSINYDIITHNFKLTSNFMTDQMVLAGKYVPFENMAITKAEDFLTSVNSFPVDIDTSKTTTSMYTIENNKLVLSTSLANAHVIRVDFYQKDLNNAIIVYPYPPSSTVDVLVGSGDGNSQIVEASFDYQHISSTSATYPILTAENAYAKLQEGKGYVASYYGNADEVLIKNVYMGYFVGDKKQDYLMPVIVFEGNDGYFGYVSAVKDEWINK